MRDLQLLGTLGTGTFGKVRLCRHIPTNTYYCVKILSKERVIHLKQQAHVQNEKWVLSNCNHPFIVKLYATFQDDQLLYFVMDYVPGGELFTLIRSAGRLPAKAARFYAAEIVLALQYLHNFNMCVVRRSSYVCR